MEAEYLVSLMSARDMIATPSAISPQNHLKLVMDDIEALAEGFTTPNRTHVEELIEFGSYLDEGSEVVVHCVMGMSRSTAAIMILLAQNNRGREKEIADMTLLRQTRLKSSAKSAMNTACPILMLQFIKEEKDG
jgi:predicted protein tyrosine phosphatase